MQYRSDDNFIYLTDVPYHVKQDVEHFLNGHYTKKGWRFPKNVHVYRELYKYFPQLGGNDEFIKDGQHQRRKTDFWLSQKETTEIIDPALRPYQNQDAAYLTERGSCLVLNEPRTGKTPTMIKTIVALGLTRNIIICPSSLVYNWAREFEKWNPEVKTYPVSGTAKQRGKIYDDFTHMSGIHLAVLIVSKDTWKVDSQKLPIGNFKFHTAVVDEAHFLRNYKSTQSKAVFSLNAQIKYALTGTPAVKHGVDVYGLLHFISPKSFPSYWQFAERYWKVEDGHWAKTIGKPKGDREQELKTFMAINSVQRKRADVMQWLPKAELQNLYVKMEGKQLKLYDQMFDVFMASDEESEQEVDAMNKLSQLLRLRQLCLDPRLLGFDVVGAKTTALMEYAENTQEPFIVMTTFSSYFKIIKPDLEKLGKRVGIIDGSISKKAKMDTAEAFQRGELDILLCNIIASGTGFTLDRAETILFLDKDFNPANNEQAQDRIVPTTEEKYHPINIISLVCGGSVDERVNEILDNKEDLTKLINRPEVFK